MMPTDITIAITVYDRRRYIGQAIASALSQNSTAQPRIFVVEDCGPDAQLKDYVLAEFGDRITYHRNEWRHGLVDNWNVCIERCDTPWLCILHDDDILEPIFVRSILELASAAPGRGLYYGQWNLIDENGMVIHKPPIIADFAWSEPSLGQWALHNQASFAGQLFNVEAVRELGGFRPYSKYSGDWDMWFRLAFHFGAAATNRIVANFREHVSHGRGTTRVDLSGRRFAYVNMQRKRNLSLLRKRDPSAHFDRGSLQRETPLPLRWLLCYGSKFSGRMLHYNAGLLLLSKPPYSLYSLMRVIVRLFSARSIKIIAFITSPFVQARPDGVPSRPLGSTNG